MRSPANLAMLVVCLWLYVNGACWGYDPAEPLATPIGRGNVFYVDGKNGSDSYDGRTEATAFRTIGKAVNGFYAPVQAGDTVLIKAGLYREHFTVNKSGTATDRIVIGAYGDGEVIVDVSDKLTGWTLVQGNIYRISPSFAPRSVIIDDVPYRMVANTVDVHGSYADLQEGKWFYDRGTPAFSGRGANDLLLGGYFTGPAGVNYVVEIDSVAQVTGAAADTYRWSDDGGITWKGTNVPVSGTARALSNGLTVSWSSNKLKAHVLGDRWGWMGKNDLYVWCIGPGGPDQRDAVVIRDNYYQRHVFVSNASYVTLYGLTVRGSGGNGIEILGSYCRVEKCLAKFNGKAGINIYSYSNTIATGNEVLQNDVFHNMQANWPRGQFFQGWSAGISDQKATNSHIAGNRVRKNGGEGITSYKGDGAIIEDNIVYDNYSVNIYIDNQSNDTIRRNYVYSHAPDYGDLLYPSIDLKVRQRLRPIGIMTADEKYSDMPNPAFRNAKIYNNLIVGCRFGLQHYERYQTGGLKDCLIANNTVILPAETGLSEEYAGISIPYNNGNNSNTTYANNIVYCNNLNSANYLLLGPDVSGYGIKMVNNVWHHASKSAPFKWQGKDYNFTGYKSVSGGDSNGQDADPRFKSATMDPGTWDYHLLPDSPAIGSGSPDYKTVVTDDIDGTPRPTPPSAGAYEVADASVPSVSITAPAPDTTVSQKVQVSASAMDNTIVSKVEFYANGILLATVTASPYAFLWDTTSVNNGPYTLIANAYDAAGNVGQSPAVNVTVNNPPPDRTTPADTTPPTIAIKSPAANSTVRRTVTVYVSASDNVAVRKVEFYVNGALMATDTAAPYKYRWKTKSAPNGTYTLTAKAYDSADNVNQAASVKVKVYNR